MSLWARGNWTEGAYGNVIIVQGDTAGAEHGAMAWAPSLDIADDIIRQHNDWVRFNYG